MNRSHRIPIVSGQAVRVYPIQNRDRLCTVVPQITGNEDSVAKKRRSIAWGNGVENIGHRDISTFLQTVDGDGCAQHGALQTRFILWTVVIALQWNCCPSPIPDNVPGATGLAH